MLRRAALYPLSLPSHCTCSALLSWSRVRGQTLCLNRGVLFHERDQRRDWQHIFNHSSSHDCAGHRSPRCSCNEHAGFDLYERGGSLPFIGRGVLGRSRLLPSVVLTIIGSGLGALLLLRVPLKALQITIAVAMIGVAVFSLLNKNLGRASRDTPTSHVAVIAGYAATFLLAIYGGFFSGGYVTMLTAAFVLLFGMTFLQAVANTKVINVFSSGVATLVFVWRGVVDLRLGIILGISMFLGALLGARIALFLSTVWLRRIFIAAVLGLAIKLLLPLH